MAGMRDKLIHDYMNVNVLVARRTATEDLPTPVDASTGGPYTDWRCGTSGIPTRQGRIAASIWLISRMPSVPWWIRTESRKWTIDSNTPRSDCASSGGQTTGFYSW